METPNLNNLRVLITRPAHQADKLCSMIGEAGGRPVRLPAIAIVPPPDTKPAHAALDNIEKYQLIIFVSSNAVQMAHSLMGTHMLPDDATVAAIGQATAHALEIAYGRKPDLTPTRAFDSEALLKEKALQDMTDKHVLIVRGHGGREFLGDTLRERGATVDYAEVYRRAMPDIDVHSIVGDDPVNSLDLVTVTSAETMDNLMALFDNAGMGDRLRLLPIIVVSNRVAERAEAYSFENDIVVMHEAGDDAMFKAIADWAAES